jgi:hypothetical protein
VALCSDLGALADNCFDRCALLWCGVIFHAVNAPTLIWRRTTGVFISRSEGRNLDSPAPRPPGRGFLFLGRLTEVLSLRSVLASFYACGPFSNLPGRRVPSREWLELKVA